MMEDETDQIRSTRPMTLDAMSITALRERIGALRDEIAACEAEIAKKENTRAAADALFKPK
jgi:uncharacterized small protein (DUF1192 family)